MSLSEATKHEDGYTTQSVTYESEMPDHGYRPSHTTLPMRAGLYFPSHSG